MFSHFEVTKDEHKTNQKRLEGVLLSFLIRRGQP